MVIQKILICNSLKTIKWWCPYQKCSSRVLAFRSLLQGGGLSLKTWFMCRRGWGAMEYPLKRFCWGSRLIAVLHCRLSHCSAPSRRPPLATMPLAPWFTSAPALQVPLLVAYVLKRNILTFEGLCSSLGSYSVWSSGVQFYWVNNKFFPF